MRREFSGRNLPGWKERGPFGHERLSGTDRCEHRPLSLAARYGWSSGSPEAKTKRLKEKIATLREEIERINALNARMMASEDKQISLTDPDARSMATSGKGSGIVG
jgi:hypothetical protein